VLIYRRTGWIVPALLALLAASTKILNAMGFLVVAGILILLALIYWRRHGFQAVFPWLRIGLAIVLAVGLVYVLWENVSNHHIVPNWENPNAWKNNRPLTGLPFNEWLQSMVSGFRLGSISYLDPKVTSTVLVSWVVASALILNSAPFVGLALFRRATARWLLAMAVFVGCLAYPLVVQIQAFLSAHSYFPNVTPRYGLSLIPMSIAILAMVAATRGLRITSIATVGAGFVIVLTTTAGVLP
jgi:hypothetical protein